jgi:acetolactate synthase-1/2/3 large subunit
MINIIGDHATYHTQYDAQLQSDIETVAKNVSTWIKTTPETAQLASDAAEAVMVATGPPAQIATLILPADVSWGEGAEPAQARQPVQARRASDTTVQAIADVIRRSGKKVALLLGNRVLLEPGLRAASQIAEKSGAKLFCEVFPTRLERGAGLPGVERIAYLAEMASVQLDGYDHLILVDAKAPVSFFAYPGKKSYLVPDRCTAHTLVEKDEDALGSLQALVEAVGATDTAPKLQDAERPKLPKGKLNASKVCQAIGALLPENAIISDEAQTSGVKLPSFTAGAPRHDVLALTGGAIGQGLPAAVGAATAAPDRPVLALIGDGSAMYTIQALWTIAREGLDVTTIIFNNRSYGILNIELERVGARKVGPKAKAQLDLAEPALDFVAMAQAMGVYARRVDTAKALNTALDEAFKTRGPYLIDAVVPSEYEGLKLKALPHMLNALGSVPTPVAKAIKKKLSP